MRIRIILFSNKILEIKILLSFFQDQETNQKRNQITNKIRIKIKNEILVKNQEIPKKTPIKIILAIRLHKRQTIPQIIPILEDMKENFQINRSSIKLEKVVEILKKNQQQIHFKQINKVNILIIQHFNQLEVIN